MGNPGGGSADLSAFRIVGGAGVEGHRAPDLRQLGARLGSIAALAISAGLLTNAVFAKGGTGSGGNHSQSQKASSTFNTFKLNTNNNSNSISGISKKPITLSQTFKKQDFNFKKLDINKDHKNSPLGISVNSLKKDNHKDMFCKKDNKCWFDWCYSKNHCYP